MSEIFKSKFFVDFACAPLYTRERYIGITFQNVIKPLVQVSCLESTHFESLVTFWNVMFIEI